MSARTKTPVALAGLVALLATGGCQSTSDTSAASALARRPTHSSSMAISADEKKLAVVNPEADSVSVLDLATRTLDREILLAPTAPTPDPSTGAFTPAVMPRSVAFSPDGKVLYVAGERSNSVLAVDVASGVIRGAAPVGSEPISVLLSRDGAAIFVSCSQDATVVKLDASTLAVTATVTVSSEPWGLGWSPDGASLLVTHLMGPGLTAIDPEAMTVQATWTIPDVAPRGDKRLAHGQVRGLYDVAPRPGSSELWAVHALLGTDTAQPELDFESTAFPALSLLNSDGTFIHTISTDSKDVPGLDGSIGDVVSGPHALAFTESGDYALMVDSNSEDVLVLDARQRMEATLVRPLPGKMPDGVVISADERFAYVDERISGDVAVLRLDRSSGVLRPTVDGPPIARLASDPMPAELRLGQYLFNTANSSQYPVTTDHWIACATCHMEGRSDAVTWKFAQGPRDTPSNAGGTLGTGFLFRTADRNRVQDYWHTINVEQGGRFDPTAQSDELDALAQYVNLAIPLPMPPSTASALVARGADVFAAAGCGSCHSGARFTDSGAGNPDLDLGGVILLHDVGTCVTAGEFPDVAHSSVDDQPRAACDFDTPSLNGVASSPPYLHDGSAATLRDSILRMPNAPASPDDLDALVEYVRSL
jgi:YVTN family beta-propeller protein